MKVTLNLVGMVRDYYPVALDFSDGPAVVECAPGISVRALLDRFGVPAEDEYFIMVGDERVDMASAPARPLRDGDAVSLIAVLKGG